MIRIDEYSLCVKEWPTRCAEKLKPYVVLGPTLLVLGCAGSPQQEASSWRPLRSLADIRANNSDAPKMKMALIALPDRIYEVPLYQSVRVAIAPSVTAEAKPVAPQAVPVTTASPRLNLALASNAPVSLPQTPPQASAAQQATAAPMATPAPVAAVEIAPHAPAVKVAVAAPATSAAASLPPRAPEVIKTAAPAVPLSPKGAPTLKFDTDYESIQHQIRFGFDRYDLGPQGQALMARILPDAKVATQIKLTGYSDGIGSRSANERVANARATTIRDALIQHDVAPDVISVAPPVVMTPPASRRSPAYHAQFRRVDVDIIRPKPALLISLSDQMTLPR